MTAIRRSFTWSGLEKRLGGHDGMMVSIIELGVIDEYSRGMDVVDNEFAQR